MLKSAIVYRILPAYHMPDTGALEEVLQRQRFVECGPTQQESAGWVAPRGEEHGVMIENVAGQRILKLRVQTKAVPGSAVKDELEKKLAQIERETGRKPAGKRKKELKEEVILEMLPRAFAKNGVTTVWLDTDNRFLVVNAGSIKKADRVTSRLIEAFAEAGGSLALSLLSTNMAPDTGMAHWLKTQEAPFEFTVDRECELKSFEGEKATVRYARHNLEIEQVVEHIEQGKKPTKLAMTWNGRLSFVLGDDLSLKKLELLDVVFEGKQKGSADETFDADVALMTGELQRLLPALINALDGEQEPKVDGPVAGPGSSASEQAGTKTATNESSATVQPLAA